MKLPCLKFQITQFELTQHKKFRYFSHWLYMHVRKALKITKVRKLAKIRKRYNQVPHLTQDTTLESNNNTINITNKSQEVSPFPAGDHKAAINGRESIKLKTKQ